MSAFGPKRTSQLARATSASDPKRTLPQPRAPHPHRESAGRLTSFLQSSSALVERNGHKHRLIAAPLDVEHDSGKPVVLRLLDGLGHVLRRVHGIVAGFDDDVALLDALQSRVRVRVDVRDDDAVLCPGPASR